MRYYLKCVNRNCENEGKLIPPGSYVLKFDKRRKRLYPQFQQADMICTCCGKELVVEEVPDSIPQFNLGVFKGLPDEDKKKILKKRYDKGMLTGGNDEKEMRKREAIKKMIGYDK